MKLLLASLIMSVSFSAMAERVEINGRDLEMGGPVRIKQELRRTGYPADDYKLRSVTVVADGFGRIDLEMSGQVVDSREIDMRGRPMVVLFSTTNPRLQDGTWQLFASRGSRLSVRRVVVEIERDRRGGGGWDDRDGRGGGGRGGHGGGNREPVPTPEQCYLHRYPDICQNSPKNFCKDPAKHYREHGQQEGRIWGCK